MRIVGGSLSGRRFTGPSGEKTRPTSERVREALASAIESRGGFEGTRVLDLYAGTGAMAFESLSRGAHAAVLVDVDGRTARAIEGAAAELGLDDRATVVIADLRTPGAIARIAVAGGPFDRVFVDPPYAEIGQVAPLIERLLGQGLIAPGCILAIEHAKKHAPGAIVGLATIAHRHYGDTSVLLLSPPEASEVPA